MAIKKRVRKLFEGTMPDIGFGTKNVESTERLINKDGSYNIVRDGEQVSILYQKLIELAWYKFFLLVLTYYVGINGIFASLFLLTGIENLTGMESSSLSDGFWHAYFFSVQTFTTVGYGAISPIGTTANIIASFIAFIGLMSFALATGLFFSRFSKPQSTILFSKKAIIAPMNGGTALMFRLANSRNNKLMNLQLLATLTWVEPQEEGNYTRKYFRLPLERDQVPMFPLNWTIVHGIDENSPFWMLNRQDVIDANYEVLIQLTAFDETFNQSVHHHYSYIADEIFWGFKFSPMYESNPNEKVALHLDLLDEMVEAPLPTI